MGVVRKYRFTAAADDAAGRGGRGRRDRERRFGAVEAIDIRKMRFAVRT